MTDLVSIIVPVYNSVLYIRECAESVLAQTYRNWELLLIDDGSQDLTREICRQLCEQDQRIRLLCQEHKGVSAARNAGIKNARGTFVFFLDSDDVIHPALIEALCRLLGKKQAAVVAEGWCYEKSRLCLKNHNCAWNDEEMQKSRYLRSNDAIYEFFWTDQFLRGIGGKMIRRDILEDIKFDEELSNGEDTLFIYQILIGGADVIIFPYEWYYYRKHEKNASLICSILRIGNGYSVWQYILNYEVNSNRMSNVARCEVMRLNLIVKWYIEGVRRKDKTIKKYVKSLADSEKELYAFFETEWKIKLWVWLTLYCYPLYRMLRVLYRQYILMDTFCKTKYRKQRYKGKSMEKSRVGVITFHCADNYGAMLQAYGLKHYLCKRGIKTDIVRYEPVFMTGRHWWIPYLPRNGNGIVRWLGYSAAGWMRNLRMGEAFWARKRNMDSFRKNFLVEKKQKKISFLHQFKSLSYSCYIVGSDQIWSPGITCGLRKAYFGAFKNQHKRKTVAYAASLGGAALEPRYDREFSHLLKFVDVVSVREREAVPYVQSLYKGAVTTVLDPVMLLDREEWYKIERKPDREGYILVYMTERNGDLLSYVKSLSEHKKIPILELRSVAGVTDKDFLIDYSAGPAEFLGYIHKADYVVTNSFHGAAFSIIYQKKFMVFQHTKLGARISNLLSLHGLEHRIYERDSRSNIDDVIDWASVKKCTKENVKMSEEFLVEHVGKQEVIE